MSMNPYLRLTRLDKPIGIWLLVFPATWGVLMAQHHAPDIRLLAIMLLGAIAMRSAGCILNDLTDRKLDGAVARTQTRPLVTGEISVTQALILLAALLAFAASLLTQLPMHVFYLSLIALPLIAAYPWMKRITWWPQAFLGLTFNFGALIGWAATGAPLSPAAFMLYAACICWTLGYDTIYAMQDAEDDALIGIKSTARLFVGRIPQMVSVCYTTLVTLLLIAGAIADMGPLFLFGVAGVALHGVWQLRALQKPNATEHAGALFRSNQWLGLWLFSAMLLDRWLV